MGLPGRSPVLPFLLHYNYNYIIVAVMSTLAAAVLLDVERCKVSAQGLQLRYYESTGTCPDAERIVRSTMRELLVSDISAGAALLRLAFHDCQVKGCDGSILLEDDPARGIESELHSKRNLGIRRLDFIERLKQRLERKCPGVVSCADVVVLAARDAVYILGGSSIPVLTGRSDSLKAYRDEADRVLPGAASTVDEVLASFTNPSHRGITTQEAVALLGSHTLGVSHCQSFEERLKPSSSTTLDPSFHPLFAETLRLVCSEAVEKQARWWRHVNNMNVNGSNYVSKLEGPFYFNDRSSFVFDNQYYRDVMDGRGLLFADAAIASDPRTAASVRTFAKNRGAFMEAYTRAFIKLTNHIGDLDSSSSNSSSSAAPPRVRKSCTSSVLVNES